MRRLLGFRTVLGVLFIVSVGLSLALVFSDFQARSPNLNIKTSVIIEDKDMFLSFSSSSAFYEAGQKASFYIDAVNRRDQTIRRIDYTVTVRALWYLGIEVFRMEASSEREGRGYRPGVWERLSIEKSLPTLIPPGLYALELVAKPIGMDATGPATIIICVSPSSSHLQSSVLAVIISGVALALSLTGGLVVRWVTKLGGHLKFLRALILGVATRVTSARAELQRIEVETVRLIARFSLGQKFVFSGICLLMPAAFMLIGGLEAFANEIATLTYFSLVIGVLNLVWESILGSRGKLSKISQKAPSYSRIFISLLAFGILIDLSRPAISNVSAAIYIIILTFTAIYTIMREVRRKISPENDGRNNEIKPDPRSEESSARKAALNAS